MSRGPREGSPPEALRAPQEQDGAEQGGCDEPCQQADAHIDEGQRGQVALAALAALKYQEHEGLGEERLHEHEADPVDGPDAEQSQQDHTPPPTRSRVKGSLSVVATMT